MKNSGILKCLFLLKYLLICISNSEQVLKYLGKGTPFFPYNRLRICNFKSYRKAFPSPNFQTFFPPIIAFKYIDKCAKLRSPVPDIIHTTDYKTLSSIREITQRKHFYLLTCLRYGCLNDDGVFPYQPYTR